MSVQIYCGCGKVFTLQRKNTGSKPWLISNWTKHIKSGNCMKAGCSKGQQGSLTSYFSSADSVAQSAPHSAFYYPIYSPNPINDLRHSDAQTPANTDTQKSSSEIMFESDSEDLSLHLNMNTSSFVFASDSTSSGLNSNKIANPPDTNDTSKQCLQVNTEQDFQ